MTTYPSPQTGHQLVPVAERLLSEGRSPFRRVESAPPLICAGGEIRPSMVVWINRDSFMAGGVLLDRPSAEEGVLDAGRRCARSLGLRHFATLDDREIAIWEDIGGESSPCHRISLSQEEGPEGLRCALRELLERFKLLSVLGAPPPAELSPYFFANLARATLESALPPLVDAARLIQGERKSAASGPPARTARRKGALVLLRLLGLLALDRLPPAIQPEGLDRAMTFALDDLPLPLGRILLPQEEELPLPTEAAVRFHHLFRRLIQLQFASDRERAAAVLEILLASEGERLGGAPLPATPPPGSLLIHSDRLVASAVTEVASLPMLALTALLRELSHLPPLEFQAQNCFMLPRERVTGHVLGTLTDRRLPSAQERMELAARLRSSWPNRRFPLPASTPRWAWEFIHLLGLSMEATRLDLNLPDGWMGSEFGAPLLELIQEHFTLELLHRGSSGIRMRLRREIAPEEKTIFTGNFGERRIGWERLRQGPRSLIPLTLHLPEELSHLLGEGVLRPAETADWQGHEREIFLFVRSSLGRLLWHMISDGAPLPERKHLCAQALARGLLLPGEAVLNRLRLLAGRDADPVPREELDREIAGALHLPARLPEPPQAPRPRSARRNRTGLRSAHLSEEIMKTVFADGIPQFPEHYLYDLYRPDLQSFSFSGPLVVEEDFFGQISLCDAAGRTLTVDGEETARALEYASHSGRVPVALPRDRQLTRSILEKYTKDLRRLRQDLLRQTLLRIPDLRAAETLAQKIWKSLPFPPWETLGE